MSLTRIRPLALLTGTVAIALLASCSGASAPEQGDSTPSATNSTPVAAPEPDAPEPSTEVAAHGTPDPSFTSPPGYPQLTSLENGTTKNSVWELDGSFSDTISLYSELETMIDYVLNDAQAPLGLEGVFISELDNPPNVENVVYFIHMPYIDKVDNLTIADAKGNYVKVHGDGVTVSLHAAVDLAHTNLSLTDPLGSEEPWLLDIGDDPEDIASRYESIRRDLQLLQDVFTQVHERFVVSPYHILGEGPSGILNEPLSPTHFSEEYSRGISLKDGEPPIDFALENTWNLSQSSIFGATSADWAYEVSLTDHPFSLPFRISPDGVTVVTYRWLELE